MSIHSAELKRLGFHKTTQARGYECLGKPLMSFVKRWKMLFVLVLISGSATAQSVVDEKDSIGTGRYLMDAKGDISSVIYLHRDGQGECRYVEKLMWGNTSGLGLPGRWCPHDVAQKLVVRYQKELVTIPASVYIDLSSVNSITIEPGINGELYSVKITGSDAGHSYYAIIKFAGTNVLSRSVHKSAFPKSEWEKTSYVFNTSALASVGGKQLRETSMQGDIDSVRRLQQVDMNPNIKYEDGQTALMFAVTWGHWEVVENLLQSGTNPNVNDIYEETALMRASYWGHPQAVRHLLRAGANLNAKDVYGETALMRASYWGHPQAVQHLLRAGANLDAKDVYGETALMRAARKGHLSVLQRLLEAGADPNLTLGRFGFTALMMAAWRGDEKSVRLLLDSGADPRTKDEYDGWTAFEWAEGEEVWHLLQSWVALKAKGKASLDSHAAIAGTPTLVNTPIDAENEKSPEKVKQGSEVQNIGIVLKSSAEEQLMSDTKGDIKAKLHLLSVEHNECRYVEKLMWGSQEGICPQNVVDKLAVEYQGKMIAIPASAYIDLANIRSIVIELREEDESYSLVIKGGYAAYSYDAIMNFIGPEILLRSLRYSRLQNNAWQGTRYKSDIHPML